MKTTGDDRERMPYSEVEREVLKDREAERRFAEDDRKRLPYSQVERELADENKLKDDPYRHVEEPEPPDVVGLDERAPMHDPARDADGLARPERYTRDQR